MLIDEIGYYKKNKQEFISLYNGKFLIIKDKGVMGVFETRSHANDEALRLYAIGSYIIEHPLAIK
jgi:hypothetical protein